MKDNKEFERYNFLRNELSKEINVDNIPDPSLLSKDKVIKGIAYMADKITNIKGV